MDWRLQLGKYLSSITNLKVKLKHVYFYHKSKSKTDKKFVVKPGPFTIPIPGQAPGLHDWVP